MKKELFRVKIRRVIFFFVGFVGLGFRFCELFVF